MVTKLQLKGIDIYGINVLQHREIVHMDYFSVLPRTDRVMLILFLRHI